ncbi:MAG: hydroxymethylglutaryl-CoA synthase [Candidatus Aenigmarchaeota archaeon]|nr:hydroxymethylglutaryl-CoA synthase [Candidatus Aenigmarchaeota archaeon]
MAIGIAGYGAYIPRFRIKVEEIAKVWGMDANAIKDGLLVEEKSVPDQDEDTITISVEAARNALARAGIEPKLIGAVFVGSESHPYAVKPSGTVVAEALGIGTNYTTVDTEFACRAGTTSMYICYGLVKAGEIKHGLAIGADTAQGQPGDALEYTAAAGGAAFIVGQEPLAEIEAYFSFTSDTPDFWRREGQDYPKHGARFTGEPAYFRHVVSATKGLMEKTGLRQQDFNHVVFHMPNGKFPVRAAKLLGFDTRALEHGLIVSKVGNTYSGSSLLGLTSVLDNAKPGERILVTSFGSGAGSDSFSFVVTDKILERRDKAPKTEDYIKQRSYVDYGIYAKLRGKLKV